MRSALSALPRWLKCLRIGESFCLPQEGLSAKAARRVRALALGRALANIDAIEAASLPNSEYDVIMAVRNKWANMLFHEAGEIFQDAGPGQVIDPYVIGQPVYGPHFVGRDDVIR